MVAQEGSAFFPAQKIPPSTLFSLFFRLGQAYHPRFGLICAIFSCSDLSCGDEILVNYGIGMADAPLWYKELWVHHLRNVKGWSDDVILKWCDRQYSQKLTSISLPL